MFIKETVTKNKKSLTKRNSISRSATVCESYLCRISFNCSDIYNAWSVCYRDNRDQKVIRGSPWKTFAFLNRSINLFNLTKDKWKRQIVMCNLWENKNSKVVRYLFLFRLCFAFPFWYLHYVIQRSSKWNFMTCAKCTLCYTNYWLLVYEMLIIFIYQSTQFVIF